MLSLSRSKEYLFSLLEKMHERGKSGFMGGINGIPVTIVWNEEQKEAKIYDSQNVAFPTTAVYWFSWNLFYPDSEVYKLPR